MGWILRKFLHGRGCKALKRIPRVVGESPSLGMSKKSVELAPGDTFRDDQGGAVLRVRFNNP